MRILLLFFALVVGISAQAERLTNADVIQLSQSGLGKDLIVNKIKNSDTDFDVSVSGLVELKKAGVDDVIVGVMMEKQREKSPVGVVPLASSTTAPAGETSPGSPALTAKQALLSAKTLAISKSSLQPSRQALQKELMKRPEWKQLDLTITQYKDTADLYIDIGFVHGSILTHRYVYRIYDRRTGLVIAAGETTSWGSLAENLAKNVVRSLVKVRSS